MIIKIVLIQGSDCENLLKTTGKQFVEGKADISGLCVFYSYGLFRRKRLRKKFCPIFH